MIFLNKFSDRNTHGPIADTKNFLGGLLAGLGTVIGGAMTNSSNEDLANKSNAFNAAEAEANRYQQRYMSDTAYRRGMIDMKEAGLNPMLAFNQGGASMGSGAQASATTAKMENNLGAGITSAMQGAQLSTTIENTKSQTDVNEAVEQTNKTMQAKNMAETAKVAQEIQIKKKDMPFAEAKSNIGNWMLDKAKSYLETSGKEAHDNLQNAIKSDQNQRNQDYKGQKWRP